MLPKQKAHDARRDIVNVSMESLKESLLPSLLEMKNFVLASNCGVSQVTLFSEHNKKESGKNSTEIEKRAFN